MYVIKVNHRNNTFKLKRVDRKIIVKRTGKRGLPGVGVPTGGTADQVLAKIDGTDYNTQWVDQAGNAVASVNGQTGVVVLDQDDIGDGTTYKQYSQTEKTKLSGIATGATANDTDANLRNRASHTGTQSQSTVDNLVSDLAGKEPSFFKGSIIAGANITLTGSNTNRLVGSGNLTINSNAATSRTPVSNVDYTILPTDTHVVQVGTMSAARTFTLPLANSVAAGYEITIADESGTVGHLRLTDYYLIVGKTGGDAIVSPRFPTIQNKQEITTPYDSMKFVSNGVDKWLVVDAGEKRPVAWFAHANPVAIPSGAWFPLPWNKTFIDNSSSNPNYLPAYTIHSSMNGLVLPQDSIKVNESLSALAAERTDGFIVITGPPGAGVDTVIYYSGINTGTNTFTGCSTSLYPTAGTGTLVTNQAVTRAWCEVSFKTPYLVQMGAIASLSAHPNGYRAMRLTNYVFGIYYPFFNGTDAPSMNIDDQCISLVAQPPGQLGGGKEQASVIEIYQNSGSVIKSTVPSLATPIFYGFVATSE